MERVHVKTILNMSAALDEQNVPEEGRQVSTPGGAELVFSAGSVPVKWLKHLSLTLSHSHAHAHAHALFLSLLHTHTLTLTLTLILNLNLPTPQNKLLH